MSGGGAWRVLRTGALTHGNKMNLKGLEIKCQRQAKYHPLSLLAFLSSSCQQSPTCTQHTEHTMHKDLDNAGRFLDKGQICWIFDISVKL